MNSSACKNCNYNFQGNYCPQCGQSSSIHHIDLHYFLHDIPHSIFHIDKGFFYTLAQLSTRPGKMLMEYIAGKRVRHFSPIAFVVIMSTVTALLTALLKKYIALQLQDGSGTKLQLLTKANLFTAYPSLLIFMMIPILSFITWLCFYNRRYNYWEHMLMNTYISAYLNVFLLLTLSIKIIGLAFQLNWNINLFYMSFMFLFMAFYGFAFGEIMYTKKSMWLNIFLLCLMDTLLASVYFLSIWFNRNSTLLVDITMCGKYKKMTHIYKTVRKLALASLIKIQETRDGNYKKSNIINLLFTKQGCI